MSTLTIRFWKKILHAAICNCLKETTTYLPIRTTKNKGRYPELQLSAFKILSKLNLSIQSLTDDQPLHQAMHSQLLPELFQHV